MATYVQHRHLKLTELKWFSINSNIHIFGFSVWKILGRSDSGLQLSRSALPKVRGKERK